MSRPRRVRRERISDVVKFGMSFYMIRDNVLYHSLFEWPNCKTCDLCTHLSEQRLFRQRDRRREMHRVAFLHPTAFFGIYLGRGRPPRSDWATGRRCHESATDRRGGRGPRRGPPGSTPVRAAAPGRGINGCIASPSPRNSRRRRSAHSLLIASWTNGGAKGMPRPEPSGDPAHRFDGALK